MKQYIKHTYKDFIKADIKNALQNYEGSLLIFKASDNTKSSKTIIVIELSDNKSKYEIFNGKINNYLFLSGVQNFLIKEYNLQNFDIYKSNYYLYEV